jgi:protein TonB
MKPDLIASFALAVCFHAAVFVALRTETTSRPVALNDDSTAVDVSFINLPPPPAASSAVIPAEPPFRLPFEPQSTPEPLAAPPDMPAPLPAPIPGPDLIPSPAIPAQSNPPPRHQRAKIPHSAPGNAVTLAHGAGSGAPGSLAHSISNPKPDYPEAARRMRQEGVVILDILVSPDGAAGEVRVSRSSGFPLLDHAAVDAVRRWTFAPARTGGFPVPSRVQIPVRFSLAD